MQSAVEREYQSLSPLNVRIQIHQRYSESAHDVEADVMAAAAVGPADSLLDVGPGTGSFLARLAGSGHVAPSTAMDYSFQAASACAAVPGVRALRGDAQRLPFADGSFDVVTARHMLYHLDDPALALAEARRVLRPGGRFAAAVNRESPYAGMIALLREVLVRNGVVPVPPPDERVHGGNLPSLVKAAFDTADVIVLRRENALVFPSHEPVVAYLASVLTLQGVPDDSELRTAILADLEASARAAFRAMPGGVWREPKGYVIVAVSV